MVYIEYPFVVYVKRFTEIKITFNEGIFLYISVEKSWDQATFSLIL